MGIHWTHLLWTTLSRLCILYEDGRAFLFPLSIHSASRFTEQRGTYESC